MDWCTTHPQPEETTEEPKAEEPAKQVAPSERGIVKSLEDAIEETKEGGDWTGFLEVGRGYWWGFASRSDGSNCCGFDHPTRQVQSSCPNTVCGQL